MRGLGLAYVPAIPWLLAGGGVMDLVNFLGFPVGLVHLLLVGAVGALDLDAESLVSLFAFLTPLALGAFAWRFRSLAAHLGMFAFSGAHSLFYLFIGLSIPAP